LSSLVSSAFVSSTRVSSTLVPRSTRRRLLGALAAAPLAAALRTAHAQKSLPELHVYKSPTCGCCKDWIKHLQAAGFKVSFTDVPDSRFYRAKLGMPAKFASCHTALVDGYVIEGHVPADDIKKLLRSRPEALGLAAPGMPVGSPGMDGPEYKGQVDPYDVLLVQADGRWRVFTSYAGK
jgi:hypothetical protein